MEKPFLLDLPLDPPIDRAQLAAETDDVVETARTKPSRRSLGTSSGPSFTIPKPTVRKQAELVSQFAGSVSDVALAVWCQRG
jgi:hypothetical protein